MDTKYIRNILIVNNKQYGKSELIERLIEFCNRSMGYGEGICIPDMPGSNIVDKGQPVQLHYKYRYLYLHNISIEIMLTDIFLSICPQVAHFPLYQDKDV